MDIKNLASIQEQLGMSPGTSSLKQYKLFLSEIINKHTAYHTAVEIYRHRDADTAGGSCSVGPDVVKICVVTHPS